MQELLTLLYNVFLIVSMLIVCPIWQVYLESPFVIALSVFSNVYLEKQSNTNMSPKYIWQYTSWKLTTSVVLKLWQMFIFILIYALILINRSPNDMFSCFSYVRKQLWFHLYISLMNQITRFYVFVLCF